MTRSLIAAALVAVSMAALVLAQNDRPMSPTGTAAAQVLGKWVKPAGRSAFALGGENYEGGKWIEITYGRPLKRGRNLWGSGANYGKDALVGTPIWRAGANVTTRLKTEVPLVIGGKAVAAGEYSVFIDLKRTTGRSCSPRGRRRRSTIRTTKTRCGARISTRQPRTSFACR